MNVMVTYPFLNELFVSSLSPHFATSHLLEQSPRHLRKILGPCALEYNDYTNGYVCIGVHICVALFFIICMSWGAFLDLISKRVALAFPQIAD